MCQYDNMPIVEAWKVSGQQSPDVVELLNCVTVEEMQAKAKRSIVPDF